MVAGVLFLLVTVRRRHFGR